MRKLIIVVILGAIAWNAYSRYVAEPADQEIEVPLDESEERLGFVPSEPQPEPSSFECDGRTRCAQMTSCAEAMYFLKNCPGVVMDGSGPNQDGPGDGIPCEGQWCRD
jgi:hypothetical protein